MAFEGTMLQAIQNVPGDTKAEKLRYLCQKGNEIAANGVGWESIPELLHPLVNVEIAKISKESELIIEALKSKDATIVERVLYVDDLFAKGESPLMRFDYFNQKILAHVSLSTQFKVIKKITANLTSKDPRIAEEFFLGVSNEFSVESAVPLLLACSGDFAFKQIIEHEVILSGRFVKKLYERCPNVAIEYLKLGMNAGNRQHRVLHNVKLENYCEFFPSLMENHFDEFIECCEALTTIPVKLSKKKTKLFLKKATNALKQKPKVFLPILNLETVTKQLTSEDFRTVLRGLLTDDAEDVKNSTFLEYLEYYPKSSRGNFIRSIFNDVYKVDLYDHPELISRRLLALIPAEDRVKIARSELKIDSSWRSIRYYCNDLEAVSWWCFLPAEEAIPKIKQKIPRCSSVRRRKNLINQMFACCIINDDDLALVTALQYLAESHGNDLVTISESALVYLQTHRDLCTLHESHWNVINEIIHRLVIQHDNWRLQFLIEVLKDSIHYKLNRDMAIDDDMKVMMIVTGGEFCTSCRNSPRQEQKCLDMYIKFTRPKILDSKVQIFDRSDVLWQVLREINRFNDKYKKRSEISEINIKDYDWILQTIEEYVEEYKGTLLPFSFLVEGFPAVFGNYMRNGYLRYHVEGKTIVNALKTDSLIILKWLDSYVCDLFNYAGRRNHFVKAARWYKDIPINFAEHALRAIHETKSTAAFRFLGHLLQGSEYEEIFDSVTRRKTTLFDKDKEEAEILQNFLMMAKECNSPVSLEVLKKLFIGDSRMDAVKYLYDVATRVSKKEVFDFAKFLMGHEQVSIKKHGIRLMCVVSSLDQKCSILMRLWKSDSHRTIRSIVLLKLLRIFTQNPSEKTWKVLETCLQYRATDDKIVIEQLTRLELIPNKYVHFYIIHVFGIIEKFRNLECSEKSDGKELFEILLDQIDKSYAAILPAHFLLGLIKKYFLDSALEKDGVEMNKRIIFEVYLTGVELDSKLSAFMENLVNFLRSHLGDAECRPKKLLNALIADFGSRIVAGYKQPKITKALKQIVESILTPFDDPKSFLLLSWIEKCENEEYFSEKFENPAGPHLESGTSVFSEEFYVIAVETLAKFVNSFPCDAGNCDLAMFNVIDSLLEINTVGSCGVATKLFLLRHWKRNATEWVKTFEKLKMINYPIVESLLRYETFN